MEIPRYAATSTQSSAPGKAIQTYPLDRNSLMNDQLRILQRQPRRISITLSYHVHESLLRRSDDEGRSLSNLCAFLLEDSLRDQRETTQTPPREGAADGMLLNKFRPNPSAVHNGFTHRT